MHADWSDEMFIDRAIHDHSAELARRILKRGLRNLETLLKMVCGGTDFTYVACPDFSISLRQRRLILGLPIGGYVNWSKYDIFPLELDVNSCGVHMVRLRGGFDEHEFMSRLYSLYDRMAAKELKVGDTVLKWNFSRRNHFINIYMDSEGAHYAVFHSSGETVLFDWAGLHSMFAVKQVLIDGRQVPYIEGADARQYLEIALKENGFFLERHRHVFREVLGDDHEIVFADQHFGMMGRGEILMGCSKVQVGSMFPILTRPFEKIFLARACTPPDEVLRVSGGCALVPHGLGMTMPSYISDVVPNRERSDYVDVIHQNGSKMVTDTLEYVGIDYRPISVLGEMSKRGGFVVEGELTPVLFTKV